MGATSRYRLVVKRLANPGHYEYSYGRGQRKLKCHVVSTGPPANGWRITGGDGFRESSQAPEPRKRLQDWWLHWANANYGKPRAPEPVPGEAEPVPGDDVPDYFASSEMPDDDDDGGESDEEFEKPARLFGADAITLDRLLSRYGKEQLIVWISQLADDRSVLKGFIANGVKL